ncbi:MAG: AMP-binding protein [Ferruginibacter sp.]|nr:AMP-binding protein [Ferruginibacter sp.]
MPANTLTIQHLLARNARYKPWHYAFVFGESRFSFKELNDRVDQLCNALSAAGIRKGDKVATLLSNTIELYEVYWACAKMGAVAVPLSPLLREQGLLNLLQNSDTSLVITCKELTVYLDEIKPALQNIGVDNYWVIDREYCSGYKNYHEQKQQQPTLAPPVEMVDGDDTCNIMYTSGTTGLPKGIVISHAVRALYCTLFANAFRMAPESVVMHSGGIIFNGAFLTLMPAMYLGCTYILLDHFDAGKVIEIIKKEKVTHTILVPSQIIACLQQEDFNGINLPSLEYILSVGAPLLQAQKESMNEKLPGVFYELYGLTEGFMTVLDKTESHRKIGSVGTTLPFMDMKVVDDNGTEVGVGSIGEIIGNGPLLMTAYYKNPVQTAEAIRNGWLYTGDMGYMDEEGFLFLTGRKKDLIISGGVNVYPVDIEEVIIMHPHVKDVAVFGVPHKDWGETPVASVVLKVQGSVSEEEILLWANNHLEARYQKLHEVLIIDELPRNVAGKVLKRELRERHSNGNVPRSPELVEGRRGVGGEVIQ